jgi:hypothetical protein
VRDKQFVLGEIRRTAALNDGRPLGQRAFFSETGIANHEWLGAHWARWGDAVLEAGFVPLEWNSALVEDDIFISLAELVRKYGRYPTKGEIMLESRGDRAVPTPTTLRRRFGEKAAIVQRLSDYCSSGEVYLDVFRILSLEVAKRRPKSNGIEVEPAPEKVKAAGYVYLLKSGRRFKIGHTNNHWQRKSTIHKQTSEGIEEVHTISAIDDPAGIEKYWHDRFAEKRQHGEWFDLSPEDISAFKKRKFM